MPVQRFLELDSTYRNRVLYPNSGDFVVNIAQGSRTQFNAVDPITEAYPDLIFCPNDIPCVDPVAANNGLKFTFTIASGTLSNPSPLTAASASFRILLSYDYSGGTRLRVIEATDYFVGAVIQYSQGTTNILRRIVGWRFLDVDLVNNLQYFECILEETISDVIRNVGTTFTIYNPSAGVNVSNAFLFLPSSVGENNYYSGYVAWNQRTQNYATIDLFDGATHIAHSNPPTTYGWLLSDVYIIRKKPPVYASSAASLTAGLPSFNSSVNIGIAANPSLINSFIRVYSSATSRTIDIRKITSIIGQTSSGVYTTNLNSMASFTSYVILESIVGLSFPLYFEILQYSADSCVPFNYSGSLASNTQMSAHEVSMNTLILPNCPLRNGGKIWMYPYVYVELENVSTSSSGNRNILYSNNPNSGKAVFKVPIPNLNNPEQYPFLNLSGNGIKQIINFKPNADVKVTIRMPNGAVFQALKDDNGNGQYPDPFIQLSALFGIEKI